MEKIPEHQLFHSHPSTEPIHVYCLTLQEGWFQHLTLRGISSPLMVGQWLNQTSCQLRGLWQLPGIHSTRERMRLYPPEDIRFLCLICRVMASLNVKLYAFYILKTLQTSGRSDYKQQIQMQNQNRSEEPGLTSGRKKTRAREAVPGKEKPKLPGA